MTTKHKTPEQHVHAELIKAWADDYKCIELDYGGGWYSRYSPDFDDVGIKFRIKPNSNYALAKIAELWDEDMVELYLYWLDGGELEVLDSMTYLYLSKPIDDPLKEFICFLEYYGHTLRKKKRTVKQVLWVVTYEHPNIVKDCFFLDEGVEPSSFPEGYIVHKVPTCTIEVELDG